MKQLIAKIKELEQKQADHLNIANTISELRNHIVQGNSSTFESRIAGTKSLVAVHNALVELKLGRVTQRSSSVTLEFD